AYRAVLQRHVEVHTDQDALAGNVKVTERFLVHSFIPPGPTHLPNTLGKFSRVRGCFTIRQVSTDTVATVLLNSSFSLTRFLASALRHLMGQHGPALDLAGDLATDEYHVLTGVNELTRFGPVDGE